MRQHKIITIPSQTEGRDPYEITIPKINAALHREMMMLQVANEIKDGREAYEDGEQACKKAAEAKESVGRLIEALEIAEADPALIAEKKLSFAEATHLVDEMKRKIEKLKKELDKDIAKVEKHFGSVPDLDIDDLTITYLLIGKDILGEPWAVMACCGIDIEGWLDIDYEDYATICKELLRRNPRFFRVRHQKMVAKK